MSEQYLADQTFTSINFSNNKNIGKEYEHCTFNSCTFAQADLRNIKFTDCSFKECDLSMVNLVNTGIRSCEFVKCKMLGINFSECSTLLFSLQVNDSTLSHSSFHGMKLKKSKFSSCTFEETDFTEADLFACQFSDCSFSRAIFENTNLKEVDLSSSLDFDIDPQRNDIYHTIFSKDNLMGLLGKYDIKLVD